MLRIGVNATPIGIAPKEAGGMRGTLHQLLAALAGVDQVNEYVLLVNFLRRENVAPFHALRSTFARRPNFTVKRARVPNPLMRALPVPINVFAGAVDVFHSPSHETQPVWGARSILTVHDLRAFADNDSFSPAWAALLGDGADGTGALSAQYRQTVRQYEWCRRTLPGAIRRADSIITVSQFSRDALLERFDLSHDLVHVIPWGISDRFVRVEDTELIRRRMSAYGIEGPFILAVGRLDPQKNLLRLVEAFAALRRDGGIRHKLVVAGSLSWFTPILSRAIRQRGLDFEVLLLGHVPDSDLACFYSGAELLVFPSLYEGFGIPPLEAMACGCPVVASRAASIPEVVGDAALLVEPSSAEDIAAGMHAVLTQPRLRATLRERGAERVRRFSWERAARATLAVYEKRCNG